MSIQRNWGGVCVGASLLTLSVATAMYAIDRGPRAPRRAVTPRSHMTAPGVIPTPVVPVPPTPVPPMVVPPTPVVPDSGTPPTPVDTVSREGDEVGSELPAQKKSNSESNAKEPTVKTARNTKRGATSSGDSIKPNATKTGQVQSDVSHPVQMIDLRDKIRRTLEVYHPRQLNTRDHNAWEVMHSIIAYGVNSYLHEGEPSGKPVSAVGWLCYNNPCKGDRMLYLDRGKPAARQGVGVQGHHGQFLAILGQSKVMRDYPVKVSGHDFTLEDLIETEKLGCQAGTELTFKLIALSHYLDSDATWKSYNGQDWSISRLIQEEIKQPIRGAACGGTHRLMGLSYAVRKRQQQGETIDGQFARAQTYIGEYHNYTLSLQNPDGSFSTEWFTGRGNRPDKARKLQTTGHILEWMAYSMTPEKLEEPAMVKAADFLSNLLLDGQGNSWEIGPLGHAIHALALYDERVFKDRENGAAQTVARRPKVDGEQSAPKPNSSNENNEEDTQD